MWIGEWLGFLEKGTAASAHELIQLVTPTNPMEVPYILAAIMRRVGPSALRSANTAARV